MVKKSIEVYNVTKEFELRHPSLADILFYAKKLSNENNIKYDEDKIGVGTDGGSRVIVYLIEDEDENNKD